MYTVSLADIKLKFLIDRSTQIITNLNNTILDKRYKL